MLGSLPIRTIAMAHKALLTALLSSRSKRYLVVLPDDASRGFAPHSDSRPLHFSSDSGCYQRLIAGLQRFENPLQIGSVAAEHTTGSMLPVAVHILYVFVKALALALPRI